MTVLAAVRKREARRVLEAIRRPVQPTHEHIADPHIVGARGTYCPEPCWTPVNASSKVRGDYPMKVACTATTAACAMVPQR